MNLAKIRCSLSGDVKPEISGLKAFGKEEDRSTTAKTGTEASILNSLFWGSALRMLAVIFKGRRLEDSSEERYQPKRKMRKIKY